MCVRVRESVRISVRVCERGVCASACIFCVFGGRLRRSPTFQAAAGELDPAWSVEGKRGPGLQLPGSVLSLCPLSAGEGDLAEQCRE